MTETHVSQCSLQLIHPSTKARTCKQPRCPSTNEWIKKLWCIYTMEYYSAIKRNTYEPILMRWMILEPIIQSEVSQKLKMKVKGTQSRPTLCNLTDYTVHRILQARILEWVAFPFSRGSSELKSPSLQVDSLPAEPQGKPVNQKEKSKYRILMDIYIQNPERWY